MEGNMKHIVLKNKTETKSSIIYLSICKRCILFKEDQFLLDDGYWEEFPATAIYRGEIYKNLRIELLTLKKKEAIKRIVKLGLFKPDINNLLSTYKVCDDTVIS